MTDLSPGDPVYVTGVSPGYGEIVTVFSRGKVAVRVGGKLRKVPRGHVHPLNESKATPAQPLEHVPDYARPADVAPIAKDAPPRVPAYLAWIRKQPCAWCGAAPPSEASHHPEPGHGRTAVKTSDYRVIPLCPPCHREQWGARRTLGRMSPEQTSAWVETQLVRHLARRLDERTAA